jgi:hypothetical protein
VVIGDFKDEANHRHRHSALGDRTPAEYAAQCSHTHYPVACGLRDQLNPNDNNLALIRSKSGLTWCTQNRGLANGMSAVEWPVRWPPITASSPALIRYYATALTEKRNRVDSGIPGLCEFV